MKIKRKLIIWSVPVAIIGIVVWAVVVFGLQVRQRELDHALIGAIKKHDVARVVSLLNQGANANTTDKPFSKLTIQSLLKEFWRKIQGRKPLPIADYHYPAIRLVYKDNAYIKSIIKYDMQYRFPRPPFDTVLTLEALMKHGAKINTPDKQGETVLFDAVKYNDAPSVKLLLQHNANPNLSDDASYTPLCSANLASAKLLLQNGAKVIGLKDPGLECNIINHDFATTSFLLEHGANPNASGRNADTSLYTLLRYWGHPITDEDEMKLLRLLLNHGARVSKQDRAGNNVLQLAIKLKISDAIPMLRAALKKEQTADLAK